MATERVSPGRAGPGTWCSGLPPPFLFALMFQLPLSPPPTRPQAILSPAAAPVLGLFSLVPPPCCPLTLPPLSLPASFLCLC